MVFIMNLGAKLDADTSDPILVSKVRVEVQKHKKASEKHAFSYFFRKICGTDFFYFTLHECS